MHILVVGGRGQLGQALQAEYVDVPGLHLTVWDRPHYDITSPAIARAVIDLAPDAVINAAAWTDVDGAEREVDAAYAVNALGPRYLANGCRRSGALLVHVSTNEVFAGEPGHFYREYDLPGPSSVYARSKLAGERAVIAHGGRWLIARVAWLFGPGGRNFPSKIVAAADRNGALRLVADEFGNPTYAPDAAAALAQLIAADAQGVYHIVNTGYASRFDFAAHALDCAGRGNVPLTAISADEWPRPAQPPRHAVLVNQAAAAQGIQLRPWQDAVADYAQTLVAQGA